MLSSEEKEKLKIKKLASARLELATFCVGGRRFKQTTLLYLYIFLPSQFNRCSRGVVVITSASWCHQRT